MGKMLQVERNHFESEPMRERFKARLRATECRATEGFIAGDWEKDAGKAVEDKEKCFDFPGGRIEIHEFARNGGDEGVCSSDRSHYLLDLVLSPRPTASAGGSLRLDSEDALGSLFLVPPGETVRFSIPHAGLRTIRCLLSVKLIDPYLGEGLVWDRDTRREAFDLGGGQIEWLLRRMYSELRASEIGSVQILEGLAKQLSVEIVRRFSPGHSATGNRTGGLPPWRLRLIEARAREDAPLPSIEELAELCKISIRHLSRAFRAETGQTVGKYIEAIMAERARTLLMDGIPVGRVARRLGYACTGNFAYAFRRATGLLPNEVKSQRTAVILPLQLLRVRQRQVSVHSPTQC